MVSRLTNYQAYAVFRVSPVMNVMLCLCFRSYSLFIASCKLGHKLHFPNSHFSPEGWHLILRRVGPVCYHFSALTHLDLKVRGSFTPNS